MPMTGKTQGMRLRMSPPAKAMSRREVKEVSVEVVMGRFMEATESQVVRVLLNREWIPGFSGGGLEETGKVRATRALPGWHTSLHPSQVAFAVRVMDVLVGRLAGAAIGTIKTTECL